MTESSATAAPVVELQLRGTPHLRLDGASLLLQPKAAGLLAYLASNGETARRTIAALLWPGVDEGSAATNLRQCLRRLRKQAGCELTVGKQTLRLVEHVRHDAVSASQLADDARGELLHGHDYADCPDFDVWLGAAREREDRERTEAMVAECERLEAAGDIDAALAHARRLLAARPLEEHSHRRVIRLHYLRGDKSAAMAAFHHCESILRTQLGAEPGAETLALRETLIAAATPGLPTKVRSIPAAVLRPPVVVGRAPMLAALRDAWRERRAFIVAGDAGMGKSRLLEEFAAVESRSEALVVIGRARPGDDHIPYASMVRVLAAVQAELGGQAPVIEAQGVVLAATRQLATAAPRTLRGVIVDDLQFADAASLELMTSLACAGKAEGPCWGFALRRHRMAIEGARELRRYEAMSIAHANLAISLSRNGKVEAAIEHALTSERLRAMSREATPRASTTPVLLMRLMRDAGRYGEAMRWAELARTEIETHFPLLMSMSLAEESWLWIQLGQHRRAEACLLEARKFPAPHPWMNAAAHHRRGQIERSPGRDPRPHFEAAEASFGDPGLRIGRSAIALDLAATLPPAEGLVAARRILEESVALEKGGLALAARVRTVQCLLDAGDPRQAAATAREMLAAADGVPTDDVYRVEMWWQAQRAFDAAGFSEEARAARHTAVQWIDRVVHDELPPAMRRAFIEANPINRLLLHAARI